MKYVLLVSSAVSLALVLLLPVRCRPADNEEPLTLNPSKSGVGSVKCTLPDGRVGLCVSYTQCYSNFSIIKYGEPDDLEIRSRACPNHRQWCCADDIITPEELSNQTQPTTSVSAVQNNSTLTSADNKPIGSGDAGKNPTASAKNGTKCGVLTDGLRQLSSTLAYGNCPWCVAIFRSGGNPKWMNTNGYFCSGSLIHPRVVITAANCVVAAKGTRIWVRIGDYDLSNTTELFPHQEIDVEDTLVHDKYNSGTKAYNVALLYLSRPADIRDNVNLACVPRETDVAIHASTAGCVAGGWGRDEGGVYRDVPAEVQFTPTERATCQQRYRESGASQQFHVDEASFCVEAASETDTCPAHHGAPLFCPSKEDKTRYIQYGVSSWNLRCGRRGTPAIYTDLTQLTAWLTTHIARASRSSAPGAS